MNFKLSLSVEIKIYNMIQGDTQRQYYSMNFQIRCIRERVYVKPRASNLIASISYWKFNQWERERCVCSWIFIKISEETYWGNIPYWRLLKTFLLLGHLIRFKHMPCSELRKSLCVLLCNKRLICCVRVFWGTTATPLMQIFTFSYLSFGFFVLTKRIEVTIHCYKFGSAGHNIEVRE